MRVHELVGEYLLMHNDLLSPQVFIFEVYMFQYFLFVISSISTAQIGTSKLNVLYQPLQRIKKNCLKNMNFIRLHIYSGYNT